MRVPSVLCWFRAACYAITFRPISGHSYKEVETHEHCRVSVLKCDDCSHVSVGWELRAAAKEEKR